MMLTSDEQLQSSGEGITRTTDPAARFWPVLVRFGHGSPMRATVKATSKAQALQFAARRHPHATHIEISKPWL